MQAVADFEVTDTTPTDYVSPITVGMPIAHLHMVKAFTGTITGRAATLFSAAYDPASGAGTYVALEAFEGSVDGRSGTFAFTHSATSDPEHPGRLATEVTIVAGSGTGELTGLAGSGSLLVLDDGTHRLTLDYEVTGR